MELSPQAVSAATFKTVKKGYDPDEVRSYLNRVSSTLEAAQQQATAMEARARAAIAKMQDLSQQAATAPAAAPVAKAEPTAAPEESETISRTLLLAQRTADTLLAEARAEADSVTSAARSEAEQMVTGARAEADRISSDAKADARRVKDEELAKADGEVQSLLARRDFLVADVDHLEQYVAAQRERLRDASASILELIERVPAGLGDMRRPLLSASDDSGETSRPRDEGVSANGDRNAVSDDGPDGFDGDSLSGGDATSVDERPQNDRGDDPTPAAELMLRPDAG